MIWILNRLKERSTWSALIALASIAGLNLAPEQKDTIITAATAIVAVIFAFTSDTKKIEEVVQNVVDNRQPVEPQTITTPPLTAEQRENLNSP